MQTTDLSRLMALFAVLATALALLPGPAQGAGRGAEPSGKRQPPVTVAALSVTDAGPVVTHHPADSDAAGRRLAAGLEARDEVVAAEVDVAMHAQQDDPLRPVQVGMSRVRAEDAWGLSDAAGQVIAVIDTGVQGDHPDLEVTAAGLDVFDDSTRGRVDPLEPCLSSPPCGGHGTHVAGIAAATVDNGEGGVGLARDARVLPVRVLDPSGNGASSDIAQGVLYAVDRGADVVNLSLGGEESRVLAAAVAYAVRRGVVVTAAAGNGRNPGTGDCGPRLYPAADPWTLAVASVDQRDQPAPDSSCGRHIDLAAPGVGILSTYPEDAYRHMTGTSMATPFVSGSAALVARRYPDASATEISAHLRRTAEALPGRESRRVGHGLVDPVAALRARPTSARACAPERVPPARFADVGENVHGDAIDCALWFQITRGVSSDTYAPAEPVTRGQMASFIHRLLERSGTLLSAGRPRFQDVGGSVHADSINRLAAAGIVEGTSAVTYEPLRSVTREQMASFLVRAVNHAERELGRGPLPAGPRAFADTAGSVHEPAIDAAATAGLTTGRGPGVYAPRDPVRRDQMASFLTRTLEFLAG